MRAAPRPAPLSIETDAFRPQLLDRIGHQRDARFARSGFIQHRDIHFGFVRTYLSGELIKNEAEYIMRGKGGDVTARTWEIRVWA